MKYDFAAIEKKWQKRWEETKPYAAVTGDKRPKFYGLIEFPYPSGQGLHVGHPRPFTAMDIVTRKKRMEGYNVLFPIGFDAFGLPTENYAIKNHIHPAIVTKQNIANFTSQLKMLGYGFDWDRVVDTTDPNYYKWTQWIFLQMFKKGLAYKTTMPVNWCTSCKCVLANEEVVNGVCERCGSEVIRKEKSLCPSAAGRSGGRGLHRAGEDPAAQLDRPLHRRGDHLRHQRGRPGHGVHHPGRYPVRHHLYGYLPGAPPAEGVAAQD